MITYIVLGIVLVFVLLLCFALAIASFSFDNYADNLKKTNNLRNTYGITTLDFVGAINKKYFQNRLQIMECQEYKDHYTTGIIALSQKTMQSNSLASLAIVSHELGHAKQDVSGEKLQKQWKRRRTGKILSMFFLPLVLVGAVLSLLQVFGVLTETYYLIVGLVCLGLAFIIFLFVIYLKYKEIQIEKEASNFALDFLRDILTEVEVKICKEFLDSARLTYWASLFKSLLGWTFLTKQDNLY